MSNELFPFLTDSAESADVTEVAVGDTNLDKK